MEVTSLIGILLAAVLVIFAVVSGDDGVVALKYIYDFKSILITIGGAFSVVFASGTIKDFVSGLKSFSLIMKKSAIDTPEIIQKIINLSNVARKEGLLSLEEMAAEIDDDFLKKGILLIVDGTDPELVRGILETELVSTEGRHKQKIAFWDNIAAMGPAWGMIGTLVGLVLMLQNMSDPNAIGPAMAVALITTLYGSLLANWLCAPVTGKLKSLNEEELMVKEIMIEGLLSIQAGENPRVIEEKLKSFLAPSDRTTEGAEDGGE